MISSTAPTIFTANTPPSLLTSTVRFAGGHFVVDLLNPAVLQHVEVAAASTGQPAEALRDSLNVNSIPAITDDWVRLAVVTGIDRWLQLPTDDWPGFDDVLVADLAFAHRRTGRHGIADHYYTAARSTLDRILPRLSPSSPLFDEFALIYAAAPFGVPADTLRAMLDPAPSFADVPDATRLRERVRYQARGSRHRRPVRVVVDPRVVPARTVDAGTAEAYWDGGVVVTIGAHPGLTPATPVADRLVTQLYSTLGESLSLSDLTLSDGRFVARLPHRESYDVVVEIRDADAVGGPYLTENDSIVAHGIEATRSAYSWHRLAGAAAALGHSVDAQIAQEEAAVAVDSVQHLDVLSRLNELPSTSRGPLRPLLAELVAQSGIVVRT